MASCKVEINLNGTESRGCWGKRKAVGVQAPRPLCFTKQLNMKKYVAGFIIVSNLTFTLPREKELIDLAGSEDFYLNKPQEEPMLRPKPYNNFKERIAYMESRGDYHVVNKYGYVGKYQFGWSTLKLLVKRGYLKVPLKRLRNFRYDVELQEKAMDALIKCNVDYIERNKLNKYVGRKVGGVKVTYEGMLAGAHLTGPYSVKQFIKSRGRIIKKDGNGTSVVDYMRRFADEQG